MKKAFLNRLPILVILAVYTATSYAGSPELTNYPSDNDSLQPAYVKNIVLVHGAFADGSGFKEIYNILSRAGYHVTIVQNPLTSLKDDVEATLRILDKQDGPTLLVGHSWGGTVITEAGMHPKVTALVYIAAFQPGEGETTAQWLATQPAALEHGVLPPDDKGVVYYDRAKYFKGFAGDLSNEEAEFMSASQGPIFARCFTDTVKVAAWKIKPSYGVVPAGDKAINPIIMRNMYKRSGTSFIELAGSHVIYMSKPKEVADIIIKAAKPNRSTAKPKNQRPMPEALYYGLLNY